ncbi:hypothetical protein [Streptomyces coffeae]|uniref:Uncharacterized protein n=1 Tax=Streptomyces coffeae TaxID=621382 RepID=A0ABS1NRW5_9ACTN|nr:hypothetical protein [Streptomyces coffeae]MBL1102759.1 hypothetical protein [Streptomyces coffeae]
MSTPGLQDHRLLVHQILARSHRLLQRVSTNTPAPFADILHTATEKICNQHASHLSPHHAAWLEAEAASHIVTAAGWHTTGLTDPALPHLLTRLDQRPHPARLRLLETAAHRTNPDRPTTPVTASMPRQRTTDSAPRPRRVGPCPCACNNGGSCGGCGHAGCGARR